MALDKSHFAGTEQQLGKRTPEEVRLQTAAETGRDDADVTWSGRSFQVHRGEFGAAGENTENALLNIYSIIIM